jgi:hypothetical protein
MGRFGRAAIVALVAVLAGGCAGSSDAPSASPSSTAQIDTTVVDEITPVGGLIATIGTNRLYALERGFGLGLRNVGDEPVMVRAVQLESPLFATVPQAAEEVLLMPGARGFVLPVPYGEARCEGEPDETFAVIVVVDDGEELRLPAAEDYSGAIGRLHGRECAAAAVRKRADLRFGDRWTRDGDSVSGELVLEQLQPGEPVTVDDAAGSVIFTIRVDDDGPPILRVTDDEPLADVPVTISAERCDPHALGESKRTFIFLAWVAVGEAEPVAMDLEPMGPARAALEQVFTTCME